MTAIDLTPRLRLAADYLHKVGWTTGTEKNERGQVCLTGAIRYCEPQNGDEYLIREVLRARGRAENWNDQEANAAEVEEYLRTAEVTDKDLAEVFGPQWLEIVTVIRTMFTITDAQWRRVAASRAASWDASRAASRAASWDASRDMAVALNARDLIGQHGFTQEHYDALTGPWRKTIGRIHPDDLDIYEPETKP